MFGANQYIVNILGLSVIRELGPVLSAILVAGRSGSAITAQIGVMRVTEELDAMQVMGIPHGLRIDPAARAGARHCDAAARDVDQHGRAARRRAGGEAGLGIDMSFFVRALPSVVPIANLWIGLGQGRGVRHADRAGRRVISASASRRIRKAWAKARPPRWCRRSPS
jgi:phospholipid/cholesterol/gamma-HCH transport system permease protein